MRYFIIEDEPLAYEELKRLLGQLRPDYHLGGWANSVMTAVETLRTNQFDLLFMDIRLSDGLSFDILHHVPSQVPIIFTTAYDEYALQAFKANSVDYLLKPIDEDELEQALKKFETNHNGALQHMAIEEAETDYLRHCRKRRFLVTVGDEYRYVPTEEIRCFMAEEKYTFIHVRGGKQYVVPHTLDSLEQMLQGSDFCRITRNCIAHIGAVARCNRYFGGRLSIHLTADCPQVPLIVSRSRAAQVLVWLDGGEQDPDCRPLG